MFSSFEDIEKVFTTEGYERKDFPVYFECFNWNIKKCFDENMESLKNFMFCSKSYRKFQKKKQHRAIARQERKYRRLGESFYDSFEWKELREEVLKKYGEKCMCCGATRKCGYKMHIDHIKPRSRYPELELDFSNLQVLCEKCNIRKSNIDETDYRPSVKNRF